MTTQEMLSVQRTGDKRFQNQLILDLLPLAHKHAYRACRCKTGCYTHRKDFDSEATLWLIKALESIASGGLTHDNYEAYISCVIRGALLKFVGRLSTTPIPHTTYYRHLKDPQQPKARVSWTTTVTVDYTIKLYVEEILARCTIKERRILIMISQGYTPNEVATELHRTPQAIRNRLARLRERLCLK